MMSDNNSIALLSIASAALLSALMMSTGKTVAQQYFPTHAMEGAYELVGRDTYISVKIIDWSDAVSDPKSNTVAFSQKLLTNSGCQGMVRGFATAVSSSRLMLKHAGQDNACSLTIDFRMDKNGGAAAVRITEEECSNYRGQRCSFSGELRRKVD